MLFSNLGAIYSEIKDYDKALSSLNRAIELDENYIQAYINRGVIFSERKQYSESEKDYRQAIKLDPNNDNAYLNLGCDFAEQKLYDEAIEQFSNSIEKSHLNINAFYNRAKAYDAKGMYRSATFDYYSALDIDNESDSILIGLALALKELGEFPAAVDALTKAEELGKDLGSVYSAFSDTYKKMGDLDKALDYINKSLEKSPDHPKHTALKAQLLYLEGNLEIALEEVNAAISLLPEGGLEIIEFSLLKANILQQMSLHQDALQTYNYALSLDANSENALINKAKIFLAMNLPNDAISSLDQILFSDPGNIKAIIFKAYIQISSLGEFDQAETTLSNIPSEIPDTLQAKMLFGFVSEHKGDKLGAVSLFVAASELDPNNPTPYFHKGRVLSELGETDKAIEAFIETQNKLETWKLTDPTQISLDIVHNYLGDSYLRVGQLQNAVNSWTEYINLHPDVSSIFWKRALASIDLKFYDNAIEDLTKLIDSEFTEISKQQLYFTRGRARLLKYPNDAISDFMHVFQDRLSTKEQKLESMYFVSKSNFLLGRYSASNSNLIAMKNIDPSITRDTLILDKNFLGYISSIPEYDEINQFLGRKSVTKYYIPLPVQEQNISKRTPLNIVQRKKTKRKEQKKSRKNNRQRKQ